MAFEYTLSRTVMGDKRVHYGSWTQGNGDTGGDIVTGLSTVEYFECTAALQTADSSGTVTVTIADPTAAQAGYWKAIGY